MNRIVELRKIVAAYLRTKHPRVFYENASDQAVFPYVVFTLPNSFDDGTMETFVLEIDGWDAPAKGDTTALEEMMGLIDGELQRKVVTQNGMAFVFYRDSRMTVPDDEKRIRRRKYVYQVRTFGGD